MKIYTRTGDDGTTNLRGGSRVAKTDAHIEACGTVDELNTMLGLTRAESLPQDVDELLCRLQHELFGVGAELADWQADAGNWERIDTGRVEQLERAVDHFESSVPPLNQFILPGGGRPAALLHVARTTCRRAERRVVSLQASGVEQGALTAVMRYLNRLGDLLFVLARVVNARSHVPDEPWRKDDQ